MHCMITTIKMDFAYVAKGILISVYVLCSRGWGPCLNWDVVACEMSAPVKGLQPFARDSASLVG
jgi:hypothetical protein